MSFNDQQLAQLKNLINCQEIVRKSENTHPLTVVVIVLVTILFMYCIYVNKIKRTIDGMWSDSNDNHFTIKHDKWKDTIVIDCKYPGLVKGNLIVIHKGDRVCMGIWVDNTIKWMNGDVWYC